MKALDLIIFPPEGFHHPNGRNTLLHGSGNVRQAFLNHGPGGFELSAKDLHSLPYQRNRDEGQEAELPVQHHHHDERTDENGTLRHQLDEPIHQGILQSCHVIGNIAHDLPRLMAVKIGEGQALKLPEENVPHVYDNTLSHKRH